MLIRSFAESLANQKLAHTRIVFDHRIIAIYLDAFAIASCVKVSAHVSGNRHALRAKYRVGEATLSQICKNSFETVFFVGKLIRP